ncbi:MAG: hypothetical protein ACKO22_12800 [Cyanobium sp.]
MTSPPLRDVRVYRMDLPDHAAHAVATTPQLFAGDNRIRGNSRA